MKYEVITAAVVVVEIDLGEIDVMTQLTEQKVHECFVIHGGVEVDSHESNDFDHVNNCVSKCVYTANMISKMLKCIFQIDALTNIGPAK